MKLYENTDKTPTTFTGLKKWKQWKPTLRLLKKTGKTIMVAEGPAAMGRYSAVVLTGDGFQIESGKSGMTAAFSKNATTHTSIRTVKEVLENAIELSCPLPDDSPGTPTPSESEIVAKVVKKIEALFSPK